MKLKLGENIRRYRRALAWTQHQLAETLGVSVQSVSRWESGGGYPDVEQLPCLASVFGVSLDALMGCGEAEQKLSTIELDDLCVRLLHDPESSPKEVAEFLRMLRVQYLNTSPVCYFLISGLQPGPLSQSPEFMREMRLLVNEYMTHGKSQEIKAYMIRTLAKLEDEEHFSEILSLHAITDCDISRHSLCLVRARSRGEWDQYILLREETLLRRMRYFLNDRDVPLTDLDWQEERKGSFPQENAEYYRRISERKLCVLHAWNEKVPEEKYPLSGDGKLDIWAGIRIRIGLYYAAQLTAVGEQERALDVLEDAVGLIEKAADAAIPIPTCYGEEYPTLLCRTPDLPHIRAYCKCHRKMKQIYFQTDTAEKEFDRNPAALSYNTDLLDVGVCQSLLSKENFRNVNGFRSVWLEPIKEHPRYKAVVERLRVCAEKMTS